VIGVQSNGARWTSFKEPKHVDQAMTYDTQMEFKTIFNDQ